MCFCLWEKLQKAVESFFPNQAQIFSLSNIQEVWRQINKDLFILLKLSFQR